MQTTDYTITPRDAEVNRSEIFMLLRMDIEDRRWTNAMQAIRDAMRVTGSKEYVRFYKRTAITENWQAVTIDLAKV